VWQGKVVGPDPEILGRMRGSEKRHTSERIVGIAQVKEVRRGKVWPTESAGIRGQQDLCRKKQDLAKNGRA